MPSTRQYPLSFLGTVTQALRHLENDGMDVQKFMQRIIDDPEFRKAIEDLQGPTLALTNKSQLISLSDKFDLRRLRSFMQDDILTDGDYTEAQLDNFIGLVRTVDMMIGSMRGWETTNRRKFGHVALLYGLIDGRIRSFEEVAKISGRGITDLQGDIGEMRFKIRSRFFQQIARIK